MFLGDSVKDQNFDYAQFEDLGSAPPTMEASRSLDAVSLQPGYVQQQSDAFSAYTQSFLGGGRGKGVPTYVALPRHRTLHLTTMMMMLMLEESACSLMKMMMISHLDVLAQPDYLLFVDQHQ